jgi:hypothetical protein
LFWVVKRTGGNIPIKEYLPLLQRLKSCLPDGAQVLALADRFLGMSEILCKLLLGSVVMPYVFLFQRAEKEKRSPN